MEKEVVLLSTTRMKTPDHLPRKRRPLALWVSGAPLDKEPSITGSKKMKKEGNNKMDTRPSSTSLINEQSSIFISPWRDEDFCENSEQSYFEDSGNHYTISKAVTKCSDFSTNNTENFAEDKPDASCFSKPENIIHPRTVQSYTSTDMDSQAKSIAGETDTTKEQPKPQSPRKTASKINDSQTLKKETTSSGGTKVGKTVSCGELSKFFHSDHCAEPGNNTIFFNERGWPVKVMRLTEDSPPKAIKPWPSRSLPSASSKLSRKEKSLFTQTHTKTTHKLSKENKENKIVRPSSLRDAKKHLSESVPRKKLTSTSIEPAIYEEENKVEIDALKTGLKQALQNLDEAVGDISPREITNLAKENPNEPKTKENCCEQDRKKNTKHDHKENLQKKSHEMKIPKHDQKDSSLASARSNKYNSKEMKAYIQAKRTERKMQMSAEVRKKQEMMEMQRKNLEKLKEKATKVLKKTSAKTIDETKPKWQGPLEEDRSDESPPGIHIFEFKIPQSGKKSKLSVKSDGIGSECDIESIKKQSSTLKVSGIDEKSEGNEKAKFTLNCTTNSNQENIEVTMERGQKNNRDNRDKPISLLRKSKIRSSTENDNAVAKALVLAAAEHLPQLQKDLEEGRKNDQSFEINRPPSPGGWYKLSAEDKFTPRNSYETRRETFDVSQGSSRHSVSTPRSSHKIHKSIDTHKNRHVEKTADPTFIAPVIGLPEEYLKRAQEEALLKQESFFQSDPFNIINMMKLKNYANQKMDSIVSEKKEMSKQHLTSVRYSNEDETDAPSIVSMEDDFKFPVEPLKISDLDLSLPKTSRSVSVDDSGPWTLQSSRGTSKAHKKYTDESMKTSASSYTSEALPLKVPGHLKLTSKSTNELSTSTSHQLQYCHSLSKSIESVSAPLLSTFEKKIPVSPSQLTMSLSDKASISKSSSHKEDLKRKEEKPQHDRHSKFHSGQIDIGQMLNSAALLLQFHAELSRIDAFDQSLAQVIAAERIYQMPRHTHHRPIPTTVLSGPSPPDQQPLHSSTSQTILDGGERVTHSPQQTTSVSENLITEEQRAASSLSSVSERSSIRDRSYSSHFHSHSNKLVSEHLPALQATRLSAPSSMHSIDELTNIHEVTQDEVKSLSRKSVSISSLSAMQSLVSPRNIRFLQVMIDDAEFQRKQHQLLYKTQEDILNANYKAALTELELRFRGFSEPHSEEAIKKESDTREKIEDHFKTAINNIKKTRNHVLLNWSKRIEDLKGERDQLKKQIKNKLNINKIRSAENSPKKHTPIRSTSATSVIESSSSSESSVMTQTFDEKKRHEDKEKFTQFDRKKLEKDLSKVLHERQEIERMERLLKLGKSRRDKSTSPMQSMQEASTRDTTCSVVETIKSSSQQVTSSLQSVEEARTTEMYNSESFESPESSETPRQTRNRTPLANKPFVAAKPSGKTKVLIKGPLAPRIPLRTRRHCSSGSDESLLLSQNETLSEQSDYEGKVTALQEQKRQRLAVYNRLQRELKKAQKELLKSTAEALVKQIQVYDSYIAQTKKQLEEVSASKVVVRPQIKHPRLSDRFLSRSSDILQRKSLIENQLKQLEAPVSDIESNSLKSVSDASSTETTIQSSGLLHIATEHSSPKTEVNAEGSFEAVPTESDASEVLSSIATEVNTTPDTKKSCGSDETHTTEDVPKSAAESLPNNDEIEWVSAEKYLDQLKHPNQSPLNHSNASKLSTEGSLLTEEVTSQDSANVQHSTVTKEDQVHEEILESDIKVNSKSSLSSVQTISANESIPGQSLAEPPAVSTSPLDKISNDGLDIGNIVSIISHSPLSRTPKSSSLSSHTNDSGDISPGSKLESDEKRDPLSKSGDDIIPCDSDPSVSVATTKKSDISEEADSINSQSSEASVISDLKVNSQHYSEDEGNSSTLTQSDVDEQLETSQSELIKVFVSSKAQENIEEEVSEVNEDEGAKLDETYIINESVDQNTSNEDITDKKSNVDEITDYILSNLLSECFKGKETTSKQLNGFDSNNAKSIVTDHSKHKTIDASVDEITKTVLDKFVQDATDCMFKLNESRKVTQFNLKASANSQEASVKNSSLLDALALEGKKNVKAQGIKLTSVMNKSAQNLSNEVEFNGGGESEVFWFDEDLRPVTLQTQREAEELRLKQLQIEQEIKQLEQAQENIPSYYYVREIPNKPPPPYTPPGQSVERDGAPTRQEDVESLADLATSRLISAWQSGENLAAVQPCSQYTAQRCAGPSYKRFLFDLVRHLVTDITSSQMTEQDIPSWERTGCRSKNLAVPKLTGDFVKNFVSKKVRVLFGFEPSFIRENLIIQWSRKKRDRVDELLVRESQEEEHEWTDYSKCEVTVKNNVALSIFDNLIDETTLALSNAFQQKLQYCQQRS